MSAKYIKPTDHSQGCACNWCVGMYDHLLPVFTALVRYPSGTQLNVSVRANDLTHARTLVAARVGRGEIQSIN